MLLPVVKTSFGGGPAGVVDDLKSNFGAAGVVEPAGADVAAEELVAPPNPPKLGTDGFPSFAVPKRGFEGVCEPPRLPKDGVAAPPPKPPKPLLGLLSPVVPVEALFSPALDAPKVAKLKPDPPAFPASALPKGLVA
jgi:hypothetical protein